jgi:hypothetical protein
LLLLEVAGRLSLNGEAESPAGQPFEESGLERFVTAHATDTPAELAPGILRAVETHARDSASPTT